MVEKVVFALGLGRCGTRSLATLFDQLPQVQSMHEPEPPLIDLAVARMNGEEFDGQAFLKTHRVDIMEDLRVTHFLESSMWNSWIIPDLAEMWPHAKFVWLIRDIFSWAYSAYRRGWYLPLTEKEREIMVRIRPQPLQWPTLTTRWFKLGWMWKVYMTHIENDLTETGVPWIMLNVGDLNSLDKMSQVVRWCGFPGELRETVHDNSGSCYVSPQELRDHGVDLKPRQQFQYLADAVDQVPMGVKVLEDHDYKVADIAKQCNKFKGLDQEAIEHLRAGASYNPYKEKELETDETK